MIGELLISIHHKFELSWQTTYNERAFKILSCGIPLLTDNPSALMKRFNCNASQIGISDDGVPLWILVPHRKESAYRLSYSSFLPSLLDQYL